jgi:MFS family permease
MFLTFIPLFAQNQGLTAGQIGMVFFAQGICNALSRIPLGHLSDQVSDRKKLVGLGLIGLAVAMAGFSLSNHMTTFTVWAAVMGLSMALAFTSIGALISETVPPTHRGLAMGGYNSVIFLGLMLSSGFMGPIIQKTSFWAGFWIAGIIILGMIFGFYHLIKHYVPPSVDLIQK